MLLAQDEPGVIMQPRFAPEPIVFVKMLEALERTRLKLLAGLAALDSAGSLLGEKV